MTPTSSNLEMLARFQQKQLQEKEQKLLQLYDQQQQRAHQVAQRGSAGSNGSNGSGSTSGIVTASGKVRHMFEERRQNSVKGIDKSYPLEPLNGRLKKHSANKAKAKPSQNVNGRRNNVPANRANVVKADANGTSNRAASLSRESYASSSHYKDSLIQRESFKSYASSREDHGEPNETNGYGRHYEINIDDVIDKDAMERNRLLAKFDQVDVERRRQFDSEEFLGDELPDKASRRSSLAEQPFKGTVKKNNASPTITTTKKPAIPTGTSVRQSTLMKTTKSASLKIRKKVPIGKKKSPGGRKRSASLSKISQSKDEESKSVGCDRETSSSVIDYSTLKSTSLIFKMIRNTRKYDQLADNGKIGKVRKMVTKIENIIAPTSNLDVAESEEKKEVDLQQHEDNPLPSTSEERSSITHSDLCRSDASASESVKVSAMDSASQEVSKNIENEDEGDGLLLREEIVILEIRGNRESSVEQPTDQQEITVADQSIRVERISSNQPASCAPRVPRRASFELKRLMFEQMQGRENFVRHDSVESALRHFDSIDPAEPVPVETAPESRQPTIRLCSNSSDANGEERQHRGFERHTSAWSMRTLKDIAYRHVKNPATTATGKNKKRASARRKAKKLLEARDSIELARVPVKTKLPACRRKILLVSQTESRPRTSRAENDEATPVKSQSSKSVSPSGRIDKNHAFSSSTTARNFNARASDLQVKKNLTPYPSSKSPDNLSEQQKSRPAAKATSLKFLSRLEDSNGDLTLTGENGFSTAALKSSASAVDSPDSTTDSRNPSFDDEKPSGFVAAAQRTTRSPSSNSSMVTSRSIINGGRPAAKTKATPVIPTPAARSSPSSKTAASNDDSLSTCKICNRRFAADRIGLHEQICAKTSQKKRKQFDVVTHRVRGTELESFVQKPNKKQSKAAKPTAPEPSKSNWRRKHEDFINAIRSAKQMQAHLASGGKLSDLPPPPPSDTSDYIQCPYCSRKFNQAAADRHIPKCENMQHNKPRAPPRSRR